MEEKDERVGESGAQVFAFSENPNCAAATVSFFLVHVAELVPDGRIQPDRSLLSRSRKTKLTFQRFLVTGKITNNTDIFPWICDRK